MYTHRLESATKFCEFQEDGNEENTSINELSSLSSAIVHGYVDVVKILLKSGCKADATEHGWTALVTAGVLGNIDVVRAVMEGPADINKRDEFGWTPLCAAAYRGHDETVDMLIRAGADVNIKNNGGDSPLCLAASEGHLSSVKLLVEAGAYVESNAGGFTPLVLAAQYGHSDVVELLITAGANVNITIQNGDTPLLAAIRRGHVNVTEMLLCAGASLNVKNDCELPSLRSTLISCFKHISDVFVLNVTQKCIKTLKCLLKYVFLVERIEKMSSPVIDLQFRKWKKTIVWNRHKEEFEEMFIECEKEIANMKNYLLGESRLSVFKFLLETDQSKLVGYISNRNTGVWTALVEVLHGKQFPLYNLLLKMQLNRACKRAFLLHRTNFVMESYTLRKLPIELRHMISNFLSITDLETFQKSSY